MSEIRDLIRTLLREELQRLRADIAAPAPQATMESVTIRSSADLNAFAKRLVQLAQDGAFKADVLAGRHQFVLNGPSAPHSAAIPLQAHQPTAPSPAAPATATFASGMLSERDIAGLPDGTRSISVGKSVRLTPLARDEMARRGIKLERTNP